MLSVVHTASFGSASAGVASPVVSGALNTATGNLIVVAFRCGSNQTVSGLTDTAGNSYSSLTRVTSGAVSEQIWYAANITGNAANVVSVAMTGSANSPCGFIWEISGASAIPLDIQATGSNAGTSPITSSSFSTTNANDIIIAMATNNNNSASRIWAAGGSYVLDNSGFPAGGTFAGAEHLIVSAIQTGVTASMSFDVTGATLGLIAVAAFKAATTPSTSSTGWANRQRRFVNKRG